MVWIEAEMPGCFTVGHFIDNATSTQSIMQSYPTPAGSVRIEKMNDTFTKYHLGNNRVLHHFTAANDEHFHDHPWSFRTSILAGGYVEVIGEPREDGTMTLTTIERLAGTTHEVKASTIHKLTRLITSDCWTLIEPGPKERESGFYKVDSRGIWHRFWHEQHWRRFVP